MKASEILTGAADKLEIVGAWTQGVWARDAEGRSLQRDVPGAVCWCMVTAICVISPEDYSTNDACAFVRDYINGESLLTWNDHPLRTQHEVCTALRGAAATAEAQGQ